ncbi:hypothetical protein [Terriglobus sp. ADX1]|uniref:hypothetical protein n=1 Tax=Terriglobus sp. ADX1 TaxID=2794063 RepID=UPI002FE6485D
MEKRGGYRMKVRKKHELLAQGLEGVGQPGRLTLLEERVERHERTVQRMKGVGGALSVLMTLFHVALDVMRH